MPCFVVRHCIGRFARPGSHAPLLPSQLHNPQALSAAQAAAAAAAAGDSPADAGVAQRLADLERALHESQASGASLASELEAARRRASDVEALLSAMQAAQQRLAGANESLRAERDTALAGDRSAAAQAQARVQELERERGELAAARDAAQTVRGGEGR